MVTDAGMLALSAAITMAGAAFATAWAEKVVGAAAVGAMAENEALFGKGIVFMVLPETIVLFGFVIAFLLLGKIT
ncbi:MAG: V-type ATP synthase subunit K [Candidatus Thermoplasmatota archaeon]|nr:V-type ATP synthase subunit K [Candidatus Thermoplasmatota archaeon]